MRQEYPYIVGGEWRKSKAPLEVHYPYDDSVIGHTYRPTDAELELALARAQEGFEETRRLSAFARAEILTKAVSLLKKRKEEIARTITYEGGRPYPQSLAEVDRGVDTFQIAAEETKRIEGEVIPLDLRAGDEGRFAIWRRFPLGPVLCISPFNRPLNLVAHKVAPAIAAGNAVILKPASKTPLTALILGEVLLEAGFPPKALSVLPMSGHQAEVLGADDRVRMITFTGSAEVGWQLKRAAVNKRITLELGGNAGVIVHQDANFEDAAKKLTTAAFYYSGQACISVQRIFVHAQVCSHFEKEFLANTAKLRLGDPFADGTDIGPMIDRASAERTEAWINEAVGSGARVLIGGKRRDALVEPTILTKTTADMKVRCLEAFAPLVTVESYTDYDAALCEVNNTPYGLQAGLFTQNMKLILRAYEKLDVGGLIVNDASTYRGEHMPYGGVKASGMGREGPRYAIEEMTEPKLLVLKMNS
ncbi:MAG: aldehyde dehydrogenase family protein [Chloroflexi bacterium]|nr:aldehyde dehydrogenase family protein [Chloroflexota bacterium]